MKGAIKAAIADGLLTFMWIFCASSLGALTYVVSSALGVAQGLPSLFITTTLIFLLLFIFGFIGDLLGGATFNPTATAAFYAAGLGGDDSLVSAALRFPAQVDLHTGAIAEGVLTFIITFAVLVIIIRGPSNLLIKNWLLAMSTVALVVAGSSYTGPSMNPANAFGWAYINNKHNTWEQFYVYWICPFVGAILAAWDLRFDTWQLSIGHNFYMSTNVYALEGVHLVKISDDLLRFEISIKKCLNLQGFALLIKISDDLLRFEISIKTFKLCKKVYVSN
ncbi:hypothetical protein DH2020_005017 [Rehmannia glutinosa]|uniref:Aquaporin SIP1-2 n=1 Tax=Rehmannia glutinosa TaxID=99300 RepID=A0ABR0XR37_REHGL